MSADHSKGASHTPGPWSVETPMEHELSIVQSDKPTYAWKFIACVPYGGKNEGEFSRPVADANARLIAAAPELLEALEEAANELWRIPSASTAVLNKARAAIAKAEGRS